MRFLISAFLFVLIVASNGSPSWAQDEKAPPPKSIHLIIGLDLSASNPLVKNEPFARKAAARLGPMISTLPPRSVVTMRTFGTYGVTESAIGKDWVISARHRPEDVARFVSTVVAGLPKLVKDGKIKAHNNTNIIPFLETMNQVMDCRKFDTRIILLTDGVEDSVYARLDKITATLPLPDKKIFRSCEQLQMLGLGLNFADPRMTSHLREQWGLWADAAGFKDYVGLNDW